MNISLETLKYRHRTIYQCLPSEEQVKLYQQFPTKRGYGLVLDEQYRAERLDASIMLALAQAWQDDKQQVHFYVPTAFLPVLENRLRSTAQRVFDSVHALQGNTTEQKIAIHAMFKRCFTQVAVGTVLTHTAPLNWVAYGYREHDRVLPDWLREGLR